MKDSDQSSFELLLEKRDAHSAANGFDQSAARKTPSLANPANGFNVL